MQLMGGSSLLAKATTALQAAAAKADRAITEFKADFKSDSSKATNGNRELPTIADSELEKNHESGFRLRINLRKPEEDFQSAGAVIQGEEELKAQDFWKRYFNAVKNIKQDITQELLLDRDSDVRVSGGSGWSVDTSCTADSPKKDPVEEEDYKTAFSVVSIPPSLLLRRLAAVTENAKHYKTVKELALRTKSLDKELTSTSGEWTGLVTGLAMVRKLSHKDGKLRTSGRNGRGNFNASMGSLFETDSQFDEKEIGEDSVSPLKRTGLPQEVHGAPPDSFMAKLAELMGGMKTEHKMAEFWLEVVEDLRRRWFASQPIPRMPVDANPDLRYCSVHQQLQLINCCIARRKRRASTLASLDEAQFRRLEYSPRSFRADGRFNSEPAELYARQRDGRLLLRLGADYPAADLRMLETGEPVYSPITQEAPVLTEDSIREAEELILRTRSVGAGCSHLLSDMQAFKAANPGCILEDFVRWYSPPDWREDPDAELNFMNGPEEGHEAAGREACLRGYLSARMQSKGNLWLELWASARPVPAVRQSPLFDEELAGESTLDALENISPHDLFRQLFVATFTVGFAIAEGSAAAKEDPLKRCLRECSDYIAAVCARGMGEATLQHFCEAYEALEATVLVPFDEVPETHGRPWLSTLKAFRAAEKS